MHNALAHHSTCAVAAGVRKIDMVGRRGGNGNKIHINDSTVIWGKCFLEIQQLHLYTLHPLTHSLCSEFDLRIHTRLTHGNIQTNHFSAYACWTSRILSEDYFQANSAVHDELTQMPDSDFVAPHGYGWWIRMKSIKWWAKLISELNWNHINLRYTHGVDRIPTISLSKNIANK